MLILLGLLIVIAIFVVLIHNSIITKHNRMQQSWSDVVTQERQKTQIIPKIEELVKDHKEFEQETLVKVTAMRSAYDDLAKNSAEGVNMADLKTAMAASQSLMSGLKITVEDYPELESNELYRNLMQEVTEQEENVGASIRIYNSNVTTFNTYIEVFPNSMINGSVTKKTQVELFQNEEAETALGFAPKF